MDVMTKRTSNSHHIGTSANFSPEDVAAAWRRERPDLDHSGLEIALRVRSLAMLVDEHNIRIATALGIGYSDLMLLYALRRTPAPHCMRPTEVFRLLSVTSGAATYRIDRLVKQDLSLRVDDPEDRRSYLLQLSEKGREMVDRAIEVLAEDSNACIAEISKSRLAEIKQTLHEIEQGWMKSVPADQNPLARRLPAVDMPRKRIASRHRSGGVTAGGVAEDAE